MHKLALVLLAISIQANDIRISEVMSNPQGSEYENEFIEVYNISDHVIQINGWILSDGHGVDTLTHLTGPVDILPFSYALILDPSYDFENGPYGEFIHDSLAVYTLSTDASFGSGGLNNSGESVVIYRPDSLDSSSMEWYVSTGNGYSWERVSLETEDSTSVWAESLVLNGTPGYRNSVTPPMINLGIVDALIQPALVGENIEVLVFVANRGQQAVTGFQVRVYHDENQNRLQEPGEWEARITITDILNSTQEMVLPLVLLPLTPGVHFFEIQVENELDEEPGDDTFRFQIAGAYIHQAVSITEIMFSPTEEQQGEWIEMLNTNQVPISLQGWSLSDANSTRHLISEGLLAIEPGEYLTLCALPSMATYFGLDSESIHTPDSWPALNSSSDSVRLFDATGAQVTSVYYRGSWGHAGTSLERRHPRVNPLAESNWLPSNHLDGGTPSRINSQQLPPVAIRIQRVFTSLSSQIGPAQATINIEFNNQGMDTLFMLELVSDADIFWQGVLPSFEQTTWTYTSPMLWPGENSIPIRIIHGDETLADTSVIITLGFPPHQIAINEIHYKPSGDQAEFLELVNIGSTPLNLKGWRLEDRSGSSGEVMEDMIIDPDSMFLWTADVSQLGEWTPPWAQIIDLSSWPRLNNSSDSVIIYDPTGQRMLTHGYQDPIDGITGKSLERLALWKAAELSENWGVSNHPTGFTPGLPNSLLMPPHNFSLDRFNLLDTLFLKEVPTPYEVIIKNTGQTPMNDGQLILNFFKGQVHIDEQVMSLSTVDPGDSIQWQGWFTPVIAGWIQVEVEVRSLTDMSPLDNRLNHEIFISQTTSPVIINEVMPVPANGHGEWFEIHNRSTRQIDLKGWLIADDRGGGIVLSDENLLVESEGYLVLGAANSILPNLPEKWIHRVSQFPTLNNTTDELTLSDPQGLIMDTMYYIESDLPPSGRSLERIRPNEIDQGRSNWGHCIHESGATPGAQNSLFYDTLPQTLAVALAPNPFSPNGDGRDDHVNVEFDLPFTHGLLSVMIFDMAGRKIADPLVLKPVSHRGRFIWNGDANYGGKAATGLYIMSLRIDDQAGKVWSHFKKVYLVR